MTDAQKRQYVADLYSGPRWKRRVQTMSDDQVVAIYLSHQHDGTTPHHNEEEHFEEQPLIEELPHPTLGVGPHANEDDFPMY